MAFNANFLDVRLDGTSVTVTGKSKPASPLPIMITLAHQGELRTNLVDGAQMDPWKVEFDKGQKPFTVKDLIHVTGVAVRPDAPEPFVWQGSFELVDENAPPP